MDRRNPNNPIRGKCVWWRETPNPEDMYDPRLKDSERRIGCSCFVEGFLWEYTASEVPVECPQNRNCRYYVKSW